MGCTLFNFTDDNKWRISVLGFQPACIRSTRWRPIAESKQSAASLCMRRCQGIQHLIYQILRECKIKILPIIDAMTRFIESMMGYIEKGGCTLMPGDGCSFVLRSFRSEVPNGVAHYVWTNQLFYNIQKSVVWPYVPESLQSTNK